MAFQHSAATAMLRPHVRWWKPCLRHTSLSPFPTLSPLLRKAGWQGAWRTCWTEPLVVPVFSFQNSMSHYNAGTWGIVQGQLRPLLAPRVYTLPMVRSIGKTMVQGKNYGPQITVKRISTRSVLSASQIHRQLLSPPIPGGGASLAFVFL